MIAKFIRLSSKVGRHAWYEDSSGFRVKKPVQPDFVTIDPVVEHPDTFEKAKAILDKQENVYHEPRSAWQRFVAWFKALWTSTE